jgi:two-component system, OmpR family, response regulator
MPKVLIVDDDEALRKLMRLELSGKYEVIDSGEPEHGLSLALENRPDAIVLDLRMPKYSGYELLQTFTAFSRTQMIPVIIVSGEGGSQTRENCKQLGAAGYFEKPIDFDGLRACLLQIVKSRRHVPRAEVRVRLHVPLKLKGTDSLGLKLEELVTTDDVSLSGFLCSCTADLATSSIVEVYMTTNRSDYVGKARIVHASPKGPALRHYGCRFTEKTGPWVLQ